MNNTGFKPTIWGGLLVATSMIAAGTAHVRSEATKPEDLRSKAKQEQKDGNFDDAYRLFRRLALDPENEVRLVGEDLMLGVQSLRKLGRRKELDEFVESVIKVHHDNWRLLLAAAQIYQQSQHYGVMIAGDFERGQHRGGGKVVNSLHRDQIRSLQLMSRGIELTRRDDRKKEVAQFYVTLANMMLYHRGHHEAWRLQYLSDLDQLPDYGEGHVRFGSRQGAPVDVEGNPVYHQTVSRWEDAKTDGQRWRWALDQVVENSPSMLNTIRFQQANFYQGQFGVESMGHYGHFFPTGDSEDDEQDESGPYALHTLEENETIARLATGVKRFDLPDEFNHIKIYQQIADNPQTGYGENALNMLAQIFENRRQYRRAAEFWQKSIDQYRDRGWKTQKLVQIQGNWGRFEPVMSMPAGAGATVDFRFRNGRKVQLEAHELHVDKLLNDVKAYLKSKPRKLDGRKINIGNIGYRLVRQQENRYLGKRAAQWSVDLDPREKHFDRRITINTPLQKAGAYLLTAKMSGGNVSKIVIWISDTAIVKKQLAGKSWYYVADAVTGKPIPRANVEFFGYRQKFGGGRVYKVDTFQFAERTDENGQVIPDSRDLTTDTTWLVIARTDKGRFAHLGFYGVWDGRYYDAQYNETKAFCITDRPVYRPEQTVHFKVWVRHAQYDQADTSQFAGKSFHVEIHNPQGEKVHDKKYTADQYGGIDGELLLPGDATLGAYNIRLKNLRHQLGGGSFRVEEYKKPEFEVTVDAPTDPVMLGETITATIQARYYFGSPVTHATVKYKVMRSNHTDLWYPVARWDWCYGPGYWWFGYDTPWYPGWHQWVGCLRPLPWWFHQGAAPPELVAEQEVPIGPDGTVRVDIDTAVAKAVHSDQDHSYTITAEVVDQSRRTVVGTGKVLVARKPFKVFTWVDRGYYRVGDTIGANFLAQTLDRKPVRGEGQLKLLKITYDHQNQPVETAVQRWDVSTNQEGRARQQLRASAPGQYRLSYTLTDAQGHLVEGGYLFTVIGQGFDGRKYRFNHLELIPDKREYQPGDVVKVQINTDRVDTTVLLFVRPANGVYLAPKMVRLRGKSTVAQIAVVKKDMPNFFIEAVTVADGTVHTETKEIVVPPERRAVNVEVVPSAEEYRPGEKATVTVRLTDMTGEPVTGTTVVSVYDKSVEYVSGGSNVPNIKEFFWKWRRQHRINTQSSLDRHFANITLPRKPGMQNLGMFGATIAEDRSDSKRKGLGQVIRPPSSGLMRRGKNGRRPLFAGAPQTAAMDVSEDQEESLGVVAADGNALARSIDAGGGQELVAPEVRSNFADTALWVAALETAKDGTAKVELEMPENLTTWKINLWTVSHGTRVGSGTAEVVTRKNVILRLQAPRFLVEKDQVVLSANVHNYLDTDKQVQVSLELPGDELQPLGELTQQVSISAGGEQRVNWRVKVVREGVATIRMLAMTNEESDAMEMKLPCYVHGMLKTESWAGTIWPDDARDGLTILVPSERRVDQSVLEIRYSPTLAGAMVDALPYLIDYPYGCTEQTLNRFLPTVITQKVLLDMQLDLSAIKEKRTNLNSQEIGDDRQRAARWTRHSRNPVFDEFEVRRMVKDGVKRLTEMQNQDGGWGWFSGWAERSWPHTTAVVVHGLQIAQQNDVALVPGVLDNGIAWLKRHQEDQVQQLKNWGTDAKRKKKYADNLDALAYMILVDADIENDAMNDFLYRDRNQLAVYSKAMFGLALHQQKKQDRLSMILRNIRQFLVQDEENETAYLKLPADNYWWNWYGSETEANAYYLKLLSRVDPRGKTAPRLVKYLLNNRKHATYWRSTRDTAVCVEAFADYLRASDELDPEMVVEVWLDGEKKKEVAITRDNLFSFDNQFLVSGQALADGSHKIEIHRRGKGPVYYNAYLTNFTLEDQISRAGLEVKVNRKYYRLHRVDKTIKAEGDRGQALDQKMEKYEREELNHLASLTSGDLVEIELEIESKNDYEYVIFEDMKAAGFEPVEVRSGYAANGLGAYMELRDERVSFFVRRLARGRNSISYRMRAEIPGQFSALPARAHAMYAPELKGNSDEIKLKIVD